MYLNLFRLNMCLNLFKATNHYFEGCLPNVLECPLIQDWYVKYCEVAGRIDWLQLEGMAYLRQRSAIASRVDHYIEEMVTGENVAPIAAAILVKVFGKRIIKYLL